MKCVILKPNGSFEVKNIQGTEQIQKEVGGYVSTLYSRIDDLGSYVNKEGSAKSNITRNCYSWFLDMLGIEVSWKLGGVYGNVVLYGGKTDDGSDKDISKKYIKLVKILKKKEKSNKSDPDRLIDVVKKYLKTNQIKSY